VGSGTVKKPYISHCKPMKIHEGGRVSTFDISDKM